MSVQPVIKRLTAPAIAAYKGKQPIVALTAYHSGLAALAEAHVDMLLVGDSVGMVQYGLPTTLGVTLEMMIAHGQAVVRGTRRALVVVDMPFGTYEESPAQAFHHAACLLRETGCGAVKLEGGARLAETIAFLTARGVPVLGHIGLTPQAINSLGGYRSQGHDEAERTQLLADAVSVAAAGAFGIVLEAVTEPVATAITATVAVPTIGIGASVNCDGQILVIDDMLGLTPQPPRFVKPYATLAEQASQAFAAYAEDVRNHRFPTAAHSYAPRQPGSSGQKATSAT